MIDQEHSQKRQIFHQEIRRKQIRQLFAQKRNVEGALLVKDEPLQHLKLQEIYAELVDKIRIEEVLVKMGNFTAMESCLQMTVARLGHNATEDLCRKVVSQLLNVVIPSQWGRSSFQDQMRNYCLVIVSNIMADSHAPHNSLLPIVSESICSIYVSVSQWGRDMETIEIGWLISNCLFQKLDISYDGNLEKSIEQLLAWAQQLILINNPDMATALYRSLTTFFNYVTQFHNKPSSNKPDHTTKVQQFQVHRLILIENTVEFNINMEMGSTLIEIFEFLKNNIIYLPCCNQRLAQTTVKKVMKVIKSSASEKIINKGLDLVERICGGNQQKDVVELLLRKYSGFLSNALCFQCSSIKIKVLQLMKKMCIDKQLSRLVYLQMNLRDTFSMLVSTCRENQTLLQVINITHKILNETDGECGTHTLNDIEEHLSYLQGPVGALSRQLIHDFNFLTMQS